MFKAPIKVLHPLLTATQEGTSTVPKGFPRCRLMAWFLAHSNESGRKQTFSNNKNNEAFLDRVYIVKSPYCLRVSEEVKIYQKLLEHWTIKCTMFTKYTRSAIAIQHPFKTERAWKLFSVLKNACYDGETLKTPIQKRRVTKGTELCWRWRRHVTSRYQRVSPLRFCLACSTSTKPKWRQNPVHLFYVIEQQIEREQFPQRPLGNLPWVLERIPSTALCRIHW